VHGKWWSVLVFSGLLWWLTVPTAWAQETEHTVQQGESLSQIAIDHGTTVTALRQLNGLEEADVIWVGMVLQLSVEDVLESEITEQLESLKLEATNFARTDRDSRVVDRVSEDSTALNDVTGNNQVVSAAVTTTASSETEIIIHTVTRGEHLGTLSRRYGVSATTIAQANDLVDANVIVPGQQLLIPRVAVEANVAPSIQVDTETTETVTLSATDYHTHTELPTGLTRRTEKWIDVDLSEQRVVAYAGLQAVQAFTVSTGLPGTPTVQGEFRIWAKTPLQDMYGGNRAAGDYYYLEDVPWVQYFYEDYAFHGATWHVNFGQPMSRGCVNMRVEDAKWLFEWASPAMDLDATGWLFSATEAPGTLVVVHE
jgi:LysM repeat protein